VHLLHGVLDNQFGRLLCLLLVWLLLLLLVLLCSYEEHMFAGLSVACSVQQLPVSTMIIRHASVACVEETGDTGACLDVHNMIQGGHCTLSSMVTAHHRPWSRSSMQHLSAAFG
jgi:hypothetical protein